MTVSKATQLINKTLKQLEIDQSLLVDSIEITTTETTAVSDTKRHHIRSVQIEITRKPGGEWICD